MSSPQKNWSTVEDFTPGFVHKRDVTQVPPGALIVGSKNVVLNDADRVGVRPGTTLFGASSTTTTPITSTFTHKKRDGTNVMMRAYGTVLEFYHPDTAAWENLNSGYTTGRLFGFASHNVNTDSTDYVYFCNAVEDYSRWTAAYTMLNGALAGAEATITVDSTTGFTTTGTLRIGTSDVTYTGKTATTFTGCAGAPAAADNASVTQAVSTNSSNPKGNILCVMHTRMFVAGVVGNESALYYSKVANANDFTFSSPRVSSEGGVIDMPEGGGGIKGAAIQEDTVYALKKSIIKTVQFTQAGTATEIDLPIVKPLIESPQVGATYPLAVFKVDNEIFFTSPEGGVKSISRVPSVDYVQALQLSDPIVNFAGDLDFSAAAGIFFKQKAYIACKSSGATANDVVLVHNFQKKLWEAPYYGWNVAAWTIYDDELYFGSSLNPEIYKVTSDVADDNELPYECTARFAYNNYGSAELPKSFETLFLEGYISETTTITIKARYNYLGDAGEKTVDFAGTEETFIVGGAAYNMLGSYALGLQPLAGVVDASDSPSDLQKFRVYLQSPKLPFYELSVEVSSNQVGSRWELLRFGTDAALEANPVTNLRKKFA